MTPLFPFYDKLKIVHKGGLLKKGWNPSPQTESFSQSLFFNLQNLEKHISVTEATQCLGPCCGSLVRIM